MALQSEIYETCLEVENAVSNRRRFDRLLLSIVPPNIDHFKCPQWGCRSFVDAHEGARDMYSLLGAPFITEAS